MYIDSFSLTWYLVAAESKTETVCAQPSNSVEQQQSPHFYFKIPYNGRFSGIAEHRLRKLVSRFCKPIDIKLVFSIFKIKSLFNLKDSLPDS